MKKLFLPVIVIAVITTGFTVHSKKQFIPPGTVQINDTLFADACEISNFSWQEYVLSMATVYGKNSKEHLAALPDTLVWRDNLSYNEPYVQYYYRHPAYKDYPVVGISYEQALGFCKWRTERVKMFLTRKKDFKHHNFEYRLPTKAEWEKLAESSAGYINNEGKDEKGIYRLNCRLPIDDLKNHKSDNADVTAPVTAYSKNFVGLYNMVGNVAEMVNEKGTCKGGGWRNLLEECRVGKDTEYTKPTAWLGFRCICVVKKSKEC
jgi:formylglycine-generating enzyme required for sulfatase activity